MKWISVKEKLPPQDGKPFLCFAPKNEEIKIYVVKREQRCIKFDAQGKCLEKRFMYIEASGECYYEWEFTHWMPLPKPPFTDEASQNRN